MGCDVYMESINNFLINCRSCGLQEGFAAPEEGAANNEEEYYNDEQDEY